MALKLLLPSPFPAAIPARRRRPFTTVSFSLANSSESFSSISQTPIFLPFLEEPRLDQSELQDHEEQFIDGEDIDFEEPEDPILRFFKSRTDTKDPHHEGSLRLQKNRRSTWRLADNFGSGELDDVEDIELPPLPSDSPSPRGVEREGLVGEILAIAMSLPQNATLGEFLEPYSGRVAEKECLELLVKMGEEGWVALLVSAGVDGVAGAILGDFQGVFPVLGRAGMGERLMILVKNLPSGIQFRDLRVYNAAISGLSTCGRVQQLTGIALTSQRRAGNILPPPMDDGSTTGTPARTALKGQF